MFLPNALRPQADYFANPERLLQAFCGRWRFTFQPAIAQVSASLTRYLKVFDPKVP